MFADEGCNPECAGGTGPNGPLQVIDSGRTVIAEPSTGYGAAGCLENLRLSSKV